MSEQTYRKVAKGKSFRYEPVVETKPVLVNSEFEAEEIVTMVGTIGICLIASISRLLPGHTKVSREVCKVNKALLDLFANTGQRINEAISEWTQECWNEAMVKMSQGVPREVAPPC